MLDGCWSFLDIAKMFVNSPTQTANLINLHGARIMGPLHDGKIPTVVALCHKEK
jgi:hypothetical protein